MRPWSSQNKNTDTALAHSPALRSYPSIPAYICMDRLHWFLVFCPFNLCCFLEISAYPNVDLWPWIFTPLTFKPHFRIGGFKIDAAVDTPAEHVTGFDWLKLLFGLRSFRIVFPFPLVQRSLPRRAISSTTKSISSVVELRLVTTIRKKFTNLPSGLYVIIIEPSSIIPFLICGATCK